MTIPRQNPVIALTLITFGSVAETFAKYRNFVAWLDVAPR